ncbi:MAG: YkgJ family cysteine cluster protein [Spirochaetales bacterium]|nr:MAG: YkgJ family cysteine cluster protein [Spirochaetales bacterium]
METPFWNRGLRFTCTRCSDCCRHDPGVVFLSADDIIRLLCHMGLAFREFLDKFTRSVDVGTGWSISLTEKPGNDCIMWTPAGCSVYAARPVQCSSYPFWPGILDSEADWQAAAHKCPGIGSGALLEGSVIADRLMTRISNNALVLDYALRWETIDENTILGRKRFPAHSNDTRPA